MKKFLKSALTSLLFIGLSAQAQGEHVLRVGSDITSPPYIYYDAQKQPAGFDAEFMQALARAGNFTLQFNDTRFENLILGLNAGKFDVIASSMFIKPERAKVIDFIPYADAGLGFLVKSNSTFKPETPLALCGKRVGIIKGAAYISTLSKVCADTGKTIDIREFPTSAEASQAVMSGNVDAQADDVAVLKVAVDKTNGRLVVSTKSVLYPVVLGIGISKQHPEIKAKLESAFTIIKGNGVYQKLLSKYHLASPTAEQYEAAIGK
ncbi:ABC transporter substrate-binding protein [Mangrovibacter sp. MFB070]|uniref:ABC transporter substrate-binding protein n=1 Tax=Mangrovibacter sp. MFB070 TaxID=1224318 RepID=UPI0004DAAA46|nr:ABC transporter substrate-binding protein [Mangrovibacter sp. MFB070]KEA53556.1 ABC transporter substrate-binding protein [Mangrovibacter sp. MFB070]